MFRRENRKQLWFGVFMTFGTLLALVLLIQTVSSYVYVAGNLVVQEGLRTATRRLGTIERRLRISDAAEPSVTLEQARLEWADRISWLRLLGPDGAVIAADGVAVGEPLSFDDIRQAMIDDRPVYQMRETAEGRVLVTVSPVRLSAADDRERGPLLALLEIGVDVENVADGFVYLRSNLVIGVAAALALMVTLVVVKLRFPHYLRGKQLESQVELARSVQKNLLPAARVTTGLAEVSAECRPASHVGGDFYDVFETAEGRLALMLGDVAGKGIAAAPLMGFIHGAAHASAWTESRSDHEQATGRLNDLLFQKTTADRFISMFWASFDPATSKLGYVNAGHLPALLIRERVPGPRTVRLPAGGPVLGVVPHAGYARDEVEIAPGDMLVVYSDGIAEASSPSREEFGEDRIVDAVARHRTESTGVIRDAILGDVRAFAGEEPADDQTLIVLRFTGVAERTRDAIATPEPRFVHG